jgi:hypothetical protein
MPSRLYDLAVSALDGRERRALEALLVQIGASGLPAGNQLIENLRAEAHLVGDEGFGDSTELTSFLRTCGSNRRRSIDAAARYEESCERHELRGLRIPRAHLPPQLLRYTTSRRFASAVVESVLGKTARVDFDNDVLVDEIFADLASSWDSSRLSSVPLGSRDVVFATFDHPAGAPRTDACALADALALPFLGEPRTADEMLIELSYPTRAVVETRFPTVADAGLAHLFRPAPEVEPSPAEPRTCCGWTEPIGSHPPQPEVVHANAAAGILDRPPRFVGRVPL